MRIILGDNEQLAKLKNCTYFATSFFRQPLLKNYLEMNNLLINKIAVVFGAGGNLGRNVVEAFSTQGATVHASDISLDAMSGIPDGIEKKRLDVLDEKAVADYLDTVVKDKGTIDIIINLSGSDPADYNHGKPAIDVSLEQLLIPMRTATGSQFLTAKAGYKYMSGQKSGVIIFITSTLSKIAPSWTTALTISHAATEAMTRTLANEWSPEGIRVICVRSEAMIESPTIAYTFATMGANIGMSREEMQASIEQKVPMRRLTSGAETAKVAVLAASDLAGFMTGAILNHSGGHVLD